MDSLYMRQQMMYQMMPQMNLAMDLAALRGPRGGQELPPNLAMALATSSSYQMGWASYAGGMQGVADQYGNMGQYGAMAAAFSMSMPGPYTMVAIAIAGTGQMNMDDNKIEVAGTGMGQDKKYKMLPGEMLAVYSALKEKGNMSPDDMQKFLKEKYGIDTEIKKDGNTSTLVNKSTGDVVMADGNGNNIMESGDMQFKDAFDKVGLDITKFDGKDGQAKLDFLLQRMNIGASDSYGTAMGGYYNEPFTQPVGGMRQGGMMNDKQQMMMMMLTLMMALQYATAMQNRGGGMYRA
jgi:hypothetical protein